MCLEQWEQSTEPAELSLVQTQTLERVSAPGVWSDREISIHLKLLSIQSRGKCVKYIHSRKCPQPNMQYGQFLSYIIHIVIVIHAPNCTYILMTWWNLWEGWGVCIFLKNYQIQNLNGNMDIDRHFLNKKEDIGQKMQGISWFN